MNPHSIFAFSETIRRPSSDGDGSQVVAVATTPGLSETFEIVRNGSTRVRIRAPNGQFLQAKSADSVTADYAEETSWGDDDPSVFAITTVRQLQGEYQLTNGYGIEKATTVLRDHWDSFIVEDDFRWMSQNGLDAVRIPVGWWIASDPNPPPPFVGGSLQALDNAFTWAEKYNLKVIVDLHAAPGSQNGNEHSGTRDGSQEWGTTDQNIAQTVGVIDFLASRYATRSGLYAIELINEPLAPGVTLDSLKKYYQDGYNTVRKYTSDAFVIILTPRSWLPWKAWQRQPTSSLTTFFSPEQHPPSGFAALLPTSTYVRQSARLSSAAEQSAAGAGAADPPALADVASVARSRSENNASSAMIFNLPAGAMLSSSSSSSSSSSF
ncbi:putative glucan 1,3-beta-glucosidase A [Ananas comosus]|uniref:Putative glucan 1,3-beta-glucosidase A n=1 Tax=Ananas comosus TaxID=4615 RepID=A0A199UU95_ANACO|nr:putative glucan 1,3-beta-glucosidase A [Ananas comosus]